MSTNTNIVRVTKAQKFAAIKDMIPADATHTFPGTVDKDGNPLKAAYEFNYAAVLEFLDYEINQLAKKNSGEKSLSPDQQKNEEYKADILNFLAAQPRFDEDGKEFPGVTCTEVLKGVPSLADFQVQKPASLLRQLKDAGKVVSQSIKSKAYFKLA